MVVHVRLVEPISWAKRLTSQQTAILLRKPTFVVAEVVHVVFVTLLLKFSQPSLGVAAFLRDVSWNVTIGTSQVWSA